jgi:putative FmdB family regulatory protein
MPTYSYACDACGGSFEIEQRISEDAIKVCTLCGKPEAHRQIVSANFILKGGGWYSDGYGSSGGNKAKASASSKPESGSTSSSSESSSSSSGGSSDSASKPAAPTKAAPST